MQSDSFYALKHPPKSLLIIHLRIFGKKVGLRYFLCVWLFDQIAMSQLINLSSKAALGVVIFFQKRRKKSLIVFVSENDHLGFQIRRNEQMLRCQGR